VQASLALKMGVLLAVLSGAVSVAQAAPEECDRECLRGVITQYLDALVAHNPKALPVGEKVKFTEDSVEMQLGEGLWKSASRLRAYRQDILDVHRGVAASQAVLEEKDAPVLLMLRLRVVDKKITEIETMVTRSQKEGGLFNPDGLQTPRKAMSIVPEGGELMKLDDAMQTASTYPAGLKLGSFVLAGTPFAGDAYRLENGVVTAGQGCSRAGCENMLTQTIMKHPNIHSRIKAVDEELGIVLLRMNFGDTGSYGPGNALIVWEAFKVYGGQIHAVEAFMKIMPATMGSGWD